MPRSAADTTDGATPEPRHGADNAAPAPAEPPAGTVYLVGAGPGDPQLATVKAVRLIAEADVVVYDRLANPALLEAARADAVLIDAGKLPDRHKLTQDEINATLAEWALKGRTVVRLKGGDPYVFGRGSEEGIYLAERGIPIEVVPGVTAAIAAPAYAGIPVTHRQVATTLTLVTGHEDPTKDETQVDYKPLAALAAAGGTLCFYMGMGRLQTIVAELMRHGLAGGTPVAIIRWGTLPDQRSLRSTLDAVADDVRAAGIGSPAIILVGRVVGVDRAGALDWFERLPLFGRTVLVTRTRHQASRLRARLEELGARVLEAPTIRIEPPDDFSAVDDAIRGIGGYDWLILTSVNGVEGLRERLAALGLDARHLAGVKVAAIGDATAEAIGAIGITPDLVPTRFVAESLAGELIGREPMADKRVLMLRADIARPTLVEMLTDAGAAVDDVCIYHTRQADHLPDAIVGALESGAVDYITFTSSSTVRNLVAMLGDKRAVLDSTHAASIGPVTSATARELGVEPAFEASVHTIDGLIAALSAHAAATGA